MSCLINNNYPESLGGAKAPPRPPTPKCSPVCVCVFVPVCVTACVCYVTDCHSF